MTEQKKGNPFLEAGNMMFSLMMLAVVAMVVSIGAIGIVSVAKSNGATAAGTGAPTTVQVTLTEFAIEMSPSVVPPGPVILNVHNAGAAEHNLAAPSLNKRTPNIPVGGHVSLELGDVSSGVDIICEVPGHKESGMATTLTVSASATASGSSDTTMPAMTNDQMDKAMEEVAAKFAKVKTKGEGGLELEPTIASDGTKVFNLEAKIVDWEVEPGKIVKGWTYNGQIPGPTMHVNVGDKVRLVLKNSLTESTSLHLHGIRVPNAMDGVDPYTQKAIKPGETFNYEFTAKEPAVGMYHSHHNAQVQIPNGMAGALIIGDWKKIAMDTAGGRTKDANGKVEQEVVMVLNDAGTIGLSLNGKSFPATKPYTMKLGETMLVQYYNEGLMAHPMHMHQPHGLVVAKDGIPLESPYWTDTINIAPGERYSVLYTGQDAGVWAWHCHILNHAETSSGMRWMVTAVIVS